MQPKNKVCKCPVCGVSYHADKVRLRFGRQTTCSRKCSYQLRADGLRKSVAVRCGTCNAKFERAPSHIKSKHGAVYCSKRCQYAGRVLGLTPRVVIRPYVVIPNPEVRKKAGQRAAATRKERGNNRHSEATRRRLAHATASNIASGKINRVSKIEDVVAEELTRLGVSFRRQVGIRGADGRYAACVDFLIDNKIVLEVNGTFWHADPRFYPDRENLAPSQRRTVERYAAKVDLLGKSGLDLIEVWEHDLSQCRNSAVAKALGRVV